MVPLKYLSIFWRTLEMPLINCEVSLILTWPANCVIIYTDTANNIPTFTITKAKFRESTKLISIFRKRTTLFNFKQDMFRE